ncbi:MAG: hypothetical protein JWM59_3120 [Verrucomicrobiales bacterium]|nr:hypothetical protein [Verrucomicrobiales bacterium]
MKKHILLPCLFLVSLPGCPTSGFARENPVASPPSEPPTPQTAPVPPSAAALESSAVLRASQFLPPDLVASPLHRVRELVPTDGYLAYYTVDTDFGSFEIIGTSQLRRCVQEIQAIARLNAVSRSDIFADGLRRSLEQPIDAAKNVVTNPVAAVKAMPSTVGHFFKKVGNSISTTASNIRERSNEPGGVDPGAATVKGLSQAGKGILGFDKAKLECARQLEVDPYTDNPRLREEIEKVAWVFWSGGLPLRVGGMATGASLAINATTLAGLPKDIYEVTPDELALRDNQAMAALLVPGDVRNAFNANPFLTLSLRHSILTSLTALDGAQGRAAVVNLAAECSSRQQARFLDEILRLLASRQAGGAPPIREVRLLGRLPATVDSTGALVLTLPVEYISWTTEVSEFVTREEFTGLKPQVYHTGGISPLSQQELARVGWTVRRL